MAITIRLILLICAIEIVTGQFPDVDVDILPRRPTPNTRLTGRFAPKNQRNIHTPTISNKIRRPIQLKTRPLAPEPIESSSLNSRNIRPVFVPSAKEISTTPPQSLDQPVKPVSEEHQEEPQDLVQAIANLGALAQPSPPQVPNYYSIQSTPKPEHQIIQYRHNIPRGPPSQQSPQEQNVAPIQYRPQKPLKIRKPIEEIQEVRIPIKQNQLPSVKKSANTEYRGRKPVAQIIRRWREDNPDGSITWGFENDDGSYKEEVIGIDCITRGKYGYIDPDGIRREYTYETGIKCDEELQPEEPENGFVDYTENKLVLPNGKTIDLSTMGKKQARRPGPIYRN